MALKFVAFTVVLAGPGGRRSYSFSRRSGGHRYRLGGIHYRRHRPYSSGYRSGYYHGRYYSHRPGLYRRTARAPYAPVGACTISFYDFYRPPEDVVCRCCISLNYEFCIYEYNCYGTGIWGRSRSGRSRHRSYRSRLYSRGKTETFHLNLYTRFSIDYCHVFEHAPI